MKKLFVVFLSVLCVLSACNRGPKPKDSLIAAGNALQNFDANNVDKYIDLSSVISNAIDVAAKQEIKELPKEKIMGITAAKMIVVPIAKQFILEGIRQAANTEYKDYAKLVKVKEYKILSNKDGIASAKVTFNFEDAKKYALEKNLLPEDAKPYMQDSETTLVLKMKQNGDYWQITEITNLDELVKKYAPLYEEKMKKEKSNKEDFGEELKKIASLSNVICKSQQRYFLVNNVYANDFTNLDVDFTDDYGKTVQGSSFVSKGVKYSITNEGTVIIEGKNPQEYTIKKECANSMIMCQDEDDSVCDLVMYSLDM